jgi:hypothetical protein
VHIEKVAFVSRAFMALKMTTMSMKGGNTDELYRYAVGFLLWLHAVNGMRHNHAGVSGRSIHFYEEIDWPDDSDK